MGWFEKLKIEHPSYPFVLHIEIFLYLILNTRIDSSFIFDKK